MAQDALKAMLNPASIAVIGASGDPRKIGNRLLTYIVKHGYGGRIFPVNPNEAEVLGLKCYPNVKNIPDEVDLACVIVPAKAVLNVLKECVEKGAKSAIIFASGFAETGDIGEQLQKQLTEVARAGGLRFCGPNSAGIISPVVNTCTSFSMSLEIEKAPVGSIAFVTQSGALGGSLLSHLWDEKIGVSRWISSGNEADLESSDYIRYLVDDPYTKVITLFMEGIKNGGKFREAAQSALKARKPVIVFKVGKSAVGKMAAKSHTGALAGADEVYGTIFKQLGVIRASTVTELFDFAAALAQQPLPKGRRVAVVSTSGGACGVLADSCTEAGLEVPELSREARRKIEEIIPPFGASRNPVDITAQVLADPTMYRRVLEIVTEQDYIDSIIIMLTTVAEPLATTIARDIVDVSKKTGKPVLVAWTIARSLAANGMDTLVENGVPLYDSPERAAGAMKAMVEYADFLRKKKYLS